MEELIGIAIILLMCSDSLVCFATGPAYLSAGAALAASGWFEAQTLAAEAAPTHGGWLNVNRAWSE